MILYIEKQALDYPLTQKIVQHFSHANIIHIDHYKNIFDKTFVGNTYAPCWVLAKLTGNAISPAPVWYGHSQQWWFFKTTLNCVFDCSYCYLKGAFKNDFPVIFVNHEDIMQQIDIQIQAYKKQHTDTMRWYMSDWSDTQWFDQILGTHDTFFSFFDSYTDVMCESRTKSASIKTLLERGTVPTNFEIAYSVNPQSLIDAYEKWTASLDQRIKNINLLLDKGYKVGVRFMPLLPVDNYMEVYQEFLDYFVSKVDMSRIYSSFAGGLLYTKEDYKRLRKKEPNLDVLDRLELNADNFWREKKQVRDDLYGLFKQYIKNCFVCMDSYDVQE